MSATVVQLHPPSTLTVTQEPFQTQGRTLATPAVTIASDVHCTSCPPASRPNRDIESVSVEESEAFPEVQNDAQPDSWNQVLRGNPPFRPLNRNVDFRIRPLGANGVERTFLIFMLSGVMIQNWANVAWRSTIGRFTDRAFLFKLGGTW